MVRKMEDQDEEAEKLAKKRKVEEGKGTGSSDGRRQADKPLSISASPDRLSSAESAGLDIPMTSTRSKATMIKVEHQDSTRSPSITPIFRRAKPENESLPSLLDDGGSDFPVPLTPTSMARRASTARTSSKYHHPSQTYTRPALGRIGSTFRSVSPDSDGEVQIKPDPDERPPARQKGGNSISGRTVDTSKRVLDAIKKPLEPERTSESYASESIDVLAESGSDSPIRPVQRSIVPPIYGLFPETIELKPSTSAAGDSAAVASFTGRRLQDIEKENVALKKELARCRKQLVDQGSSVSPRHMSWLCADQFSDDHAECQESIAQETRRKLAAQTQVLELGETLRSKNREIKEARAEIEGLKEEVITQKEKADKKWRQVQDLMSNTQMM